MPEIRIALNEAQFRQLVAGKEVVVRTSIATRVVTTHLILSDIGFYRMANIVLEAAEEKTAARANSVRAEDSTA